MLSKLGGRKFLFALLAVILSFILVLARLATAEQWMQFVEVIGAAYVIGNVASKFSGQGEAQSLKKT
ncbi:MAG: hypothetical protein H5T69_10335 [Chloroflexi bacterium]|nr:hypothetical protein [Chloroflexota bacterium]